MNIHFSEFQPSPELTPYIQSFWTGDFNLNRDKDFAQSVVPNGCIELIIHLTDEHCFLTKNDQSWDKSPLFTMVGMYPQSYEVRFSENVKVFGIRFYPDGIRNIFGVPPVAFLSTYEDSVDVLGKKLSDLCSRIRETHSPEKQVQLAQEFITKQLYRNERSYDYTHLAMELIRQTEGIAGYRTLTDQVPISLRQLQREFKNQYGMTIRDYMRISRINAIHKYMLAGNSSLTELAYELEFTDQSHFIREYKSYVGVPPKKFIKGKNDFIVNAV